MKKLIYMSTLVLAALTINSCSSSDDNNIPNPIDPEPSNKLIGKWEATNLTYTYPAGTNTHPFATIKEGCAVDIIELLPLKVGTVKVENKVGQNCEGSTDVVAWNDETISVVGEETKRTIISVNDTELVLKYKMNYPKFGTTDVTVSYTRK
ncbi:hypothetical protein [Flavobacterium sp. NKUCC04_CG]|uniref:hypothetical protein n=1 Tax=Flavobacterium sp. NKUCC04_CG TaxID=2842121 RepID=UPI001C5B5C41|nr:hypothetical protein [Flavobacterium sp. NKUCC04_CG]MBW3518541.1 hypothetical protein [Flavobacterium sp. NKUCC04_CG]